MGSYVTREKERTSLDEVSTEYKKSLTSKNVTCFLQEASLQAFADYIRSCECENILVLSGAEMSRNGWISDLRLILEHIHETNLPNCHALFDFGFFSKRQEPLYQVLENLLKYPDEPNAAHFFVSLLHEKGMLLRHYTENMDSLDMEAGQPEDKLVQANGTYYKWSCVRCRQHHPEMWFVAKRDLGEKPNCLRCGGIVIPDVIFYNQALPRKFYKNFLSDIKLCDLMIVLGSSLSMEPFEYLAEMVRKDVPRLLVKSSEMCLDFEVRKSDVFWRGSPEDGCINLARMLGWTHDLLNLKPAETPRSSTHYYSIIN